MRLIVTSSGPVADDTTSGLQPPGFDRIHDHKEPFQSRAESPGQISQSSRWHEIDHGSRDSTIRDNELGNASDAPRTETGSHQDDLEGESKHMVERERLKQQALEVVMADLKVSGRIQKSFTNTIPSSHWSSPGKSRRRKTSPTNVSRVLMVAQFR